VPKINLSLRGWDSVTKLIPVYLAVASSWLGPASAATTQEAQPPHVTIDLHDVRIQSFFGLGIQWDPYSYPPRPEAWSFTLKRLDYAHPAFFRVMLGARDYCLGFDATNAPHYVWTDGEPAIRRRLGSLLDIL
jgi:hypothetical protein